MTVSLQKERHVLDTYIDLCIILYQYMVLTKIVWYNIYKDKLLNIHEIKGEL